MNIDGLSEMTLEKFIDKGFIKEYADLFRLDRYKEEIVGMEGMGVKSYENLMDSVQKARHTTLSRVIYSLGIPNIGLANAKMLCKEYGDDGTKLRKATAEELRASRTCQEKYLSLPEVWSSLITGRPLKMLLKQRAAR